MTHTLLGTVDMARLNNVGEHGGTGVDAGFAKVAVSMIRTVPERVGGASETRVLAGVAHSVQLVRRSSEGRHDVIPGAARPLDGGSRNPD